MSASWFVLLLSCGMVWQLAAAFPQLDERSPVLSNDEKNRLNLTKYNLLLDTLDILADQSTTILRISNDLITKLVVELKALPSKTSVTDEYIKRFDIAQKHIEDINFDDQPGEMEKIFKSVDELGEIFSDIEAMHKKGEDGFLEGVFEKIGAKDMDMKFNNTMYYTLSELTKLFHGFEKSLNEHEKKQELQLVTWFQRFDKENDLKKKLGNLMDDFFDFFE